MTTHQEGTGLPVGGDGAPTFRDVAVQGVIEFLDRVGAGTVSGNMADYPQLRAACRYAAKTLRKLEAAPAAPEPASGEGSPTPIEDFQADLWAVLLTTSAKITPSATWEKWMAIRSSLQGQATPSQASQEVREAVYGHLSQAFSYGIEYGVRPSNYPSGWTDHKLSALTDRILRLLSHPPKGGAAGTVGVTEHRYAMALRRISNGNDTATMREWALDALREGEGGPVARGGLPGAARQSCPRCSSSLIRNGERLDCINHGCGFWVHLPETPQASGEASEPATSPKTGCNLCDTHGLGACQVPHLYQAPESPKPSQGREWTLMVENETDHIACGWKETPKGIHSQPMSGCRYVRVREVVEPQERGS
jgi:hypothetical protein